jgi:hypothetical protein
MLGSQIDHSEATLSAAVFTSRSYADTIRHSSEFGRFYTSLDSVINNSEVLFISRFFLGHDCRHGRKGVAGQGHAAFAVNGLQPPYIYTTSEFRRIRARTDNSVVCSIFPHGLASGRAFR